MSSNQTMSGHGLICPDKKVLVLVEMYTICKRKCSNDFNSHFKHTKHTSLYLAYSLSPWRTCGSTIYHCYTLCHVFTFKTEKIFEHIYITNWACSTIITVKFTTLADQSSHWSAINASLTYCPTCLLDD